jgi:3-oxoacyl-[acyl-carrier-protein] synthase II
VSRQSVGPGPLDDAESRGLDAALGGRRPAHDLAVGQALGDTFCASGAVQVAALLALFANRPAPAGACGLVTSLSHAGAVGCALVRAP